MTELINNQLKSDNNSENTQTSTQLKASIDEINCIGCNKCVKICPSNAIIGAVQTTHTVVKALCTGCSFCISICPMKCIKI